MHRPRAAEAPEDSHSRRLHQRRRHRHRGAASARAFTNEPEGFHQDRHRSAHFLGAWTRTRSSSSTRAAITGVGTHDELLKQQPANIRKSTTPRRIGRRERKWPEELWKTSTARYGGIALISPRRARAAARGPGGLSFGKPQNGGAVVPAADGLHRHVTGSGSSPCSLCMLLQYRFLTGRVRICCARSSTASPTARTPAADRVAYLLTMIGVYRSASTSWAWCRHLFPEPADDRRFPERHRKAFATTCSTKLQSLPIRFFDNESNGEIMSRFTNDVDNIGTMLDSSITLPRVRRHSR